MTVPSSAKHRAPINETQPHAIQTTRVNPTLPEYLNTAEGVTNTPDPMITPMMILMAASRPIVLSGPTVLTAGAVFSPKNF